MTNWEDEKDAQDTYLKKQLTALRAVSRLAPARWRKFRLLVVICGQCGDAVVEVMQLDPYPVILSRRTAAHPSTNILPAGAPVQDRIEHLRTRLDPIRLDKNWTFYPISWPLPPAPDRERPGAVEGHRTLIDCTCRCRHFSMNQETIFADLRAGTKKRVVPRAPQRVE